MTDNLILLTGATGFVGYKTLITALEAGFRVRCAVRSRAGIDKILAAPSIKSNNPSKDQLSWTIVPDISHPGAYDEAVQGVTYIIHCASPVPTFGKDERVGTEEEVYVKPAVAGVLGLLESAKRHATNTLTRVVVTSSIVAVIPMECFMGQGLDRPAIDGESRVATPVAPFGSGFGAYRASKIAALSASEAWVKEHATSTNFDLISVIPAWIWGRDELSTTAESLLSGSNSVLLEYLRGRKSDTPILSSFISVDDVAAAHVNALSPSVSGKQSFLLGRHVAIEEARAIAMENFPQAFADGVYSADGSQPTISVPTDASEGERLLGRKFASGEDMVRDVAGQFSQLVAN
ncbi:reductase [Colletotrichum paranaense]|uniref:Reductase n=2 Tax=Colletotrichum acutatum species complex TaxID=2707335 RepID=A0ABQ9PUZ6_9PEZI|nr:reductase [Colletotrichum paranaense]KAI3537238.1 reductase [Colletotrichum filicis]KAK0375352.1 reductase [Colletotrichum limetticola]KAK1521462.1 reductase [Colletotrichum paranaense]